MQTTPERREDPMVVRARARVGSVLRGKWRLDQLIGVGGMAAVYRATHRNGHRGAVKLLHRDMSCDEDSQQRFLREGYTANAVGHAGAVSVLDDDTADDGSVFLVMELLEGETLDERTDSRPGQRLTPGEMLAIADQLLEVLAAAHSKGIVHRDLKPENIFITKEGKVKVLDFGLARMNDPTKARLTVTGASAMGTPAFMPPEQATGNWDSIDGRTDLWALGATMFTLLTGRLVHAADNVNRMLMAAMTRPAPPIAAIDPRIPGPLAAIIDRALAFKQDDRFPNATAMREAVLEARSAIRGELGTGHLSMSANTTAIRIPVAGKAQGGSGSIGATSSGALSASRKNRGTLLIIALLLGGIAATLLALVRSAWLRDAHMSTHAVDTQSVAVPDPTDAALVLASPSADIKPAGPVPPLVSATDLPSAPSATPSASSQVSRPHAVTKPTHSEPAPKPSASADPLGKW